MPEAIATAKMTFRLPLFKSRCSAQLRFADVALRKRYSQAPANLCLSVVEMPGKARKNAAQNGLKPALTNVVMRTQASDMYLHL
jgi:hypothetical protein